MLPALYTHQDIDAVVAAGYPIKSTDTPKQLQSKRDQLEAGVVPLLKEIAHLGEVNSLVVTELAHQLATACVDVSYVLLDLILRPPAKLDCCSRNPEEEYGQLAKLLFLSRMFSAPVPLFIPVCPDYLGHYRLGQGVGKIADKALSQLQALNAVLNDHGFTPHFEIQVADVEAYDPLILAATGETTASFLAKTAATIQAIHSQVQSLGLDGQVVVTSLHDRFEENGIRYTQLQSELAEQIVQSDRKKIKTVRDKLLQERLQSGDFATIADPNVHQNMVASELAGYSAYGKLIGGSGVIMSPDAMSAVPAYNFFRDNQEFNPTIYVK